METSYCHGLFELAHAYDGFILDQWGVLHHGQGLYPSALQTLNKLKADKKQVVILSNSAKRSDFNKARLEELGITSKHYNDVITAGEVVWQGLSHQDEGIFKDIGENVYLINRGDDKSLLEGLDINLTTEIEDANFILVTGINTPDVTLEDYEPILRKAVAKGLPLICANPDMITLFGRERHVGPGALAQRYSEFGGVAHLIGKPHKPIFQKCLDGFKDIIPSRILVVGDSLNHDVHGAKTLNLDSLFIMMGIHANHFKAAKTEAEKMRQLEHLAQNYAVHPEWVMDQLIWHTPEAAKHEREREKWKD